ncbi:unnamed protein product [Polarella glacialis]|uniref:Uncharacterized protein n=1 Tax=Polarella glacialis TaxID=89957 RepID=A0A813K6R7_POLGL|nr:unnamed protein product [Polarella glacialis]
MLSVCSKKVFFASPGRAPDQFDSVRRLLLLCCECCCCCCCCCCCGYCCSSCCCCVCCCCCCCYCYIRALSCRAVYFSRFVLLVWTLAFSLSWLQSGYGII